MATSSLYNLQQEIFGYRSGKDCRGYVRSSGQCTSAVLKGRVRWEFLVFCLSLFSFLNVFVVSFFSRLLACFSLNSWACLGWVWALVPASFCTSPPMPIFWCPYSRLLWDSAAVRLCSGTSLAEARGKDSEQLVAQALDYLFFVCLFVGPLFLFAGVWLWCFLLASVQVTWPLEFLKPCTSECRIAGCHEEEEGCYNVSIWWFAGAALLLLEPRFCLVVCMIIF